MGAHGGHAAAQHAQALAPLQPEEAAHDCATAAIPTGQGRVRLYWLLFCLSSSESRPGNLRMPQGTSMPTHHFAEALDRHQHPTEWYRWK
jgi:hypothetical protein